MSNTIIRAPRRNQFTIINQKILNDERLSWAAKGLICFLLSLPDNWRIRVSHLVKIGNLKRDGIYKLFRELRDAGYVVYKPSRDSQGCFRGGVYIVHEIPNTPHTDLPDTAQPDTVSPGLAKPEALPNINKYKIPTTTTEECSSCGELSVSDLVFPRSLLPAEQTQAEQKIQALTDSKEAQQVLDEWAGIISAGKIHTSKLGCLRGLIKKVQEGVFTLEQGQKVSAARKKHQQFVAREKKLKAQPQQPIQIDESNPLAQRLAAIPTRRKKE